MAVFEKAGFVEPAAYGGIVVSGNLVHHSCRAETEHPLCLRGQFGSGLLPVCDSLRVLARGEQPTD